jgi:hypothetical protein
VNKGLALLATGLAGGVVTVVSLNEYNNNDYPGVDNSTGQAGIIAGVSISLGAYMYSLATANGDVHQYNAAHHSIGDASPVMNRRFGQTQLGLALKF